MSASALAADLDATDATVVTLELESVDVPSELVVPEASSVASSSATVAVSAKSPTKARRFTASNMSVEALGALRQEQPAAPAAEASPVSSPDEGKKTPARRQSQVDAAGLARLNAMRARRKAELQAKAEAAAIAEEAEQSAMPPMPPGPPPGAPPIASTAPPPPPVAGSNPMRPTAAPAASAAPAPSPSPSPAEKEEEEEEDGEEEAGEAADAVAPMAADADEAARRAAQMEFFASRQIRGRSQSAASAPSKSRSSVRTAALLRKSKAPSRVEAPSPSRVEPPSPSRVEPPSPSRVEPPSRVEAPSRAEAPPRVEAPAPTETREREREREEAPKDLVTAQVMLEERDEEIRELNERCVDYESKLRKALSSNDTRTKLLRARNAQLQQKNVSILADVAALQARVDELEAENAALKEAEPAAAEVRRGSRLGNIARKGSFLRRSVVGGGSRKGSIMGGRESPQTVHEEDSGEDEEDEEDKKDNGVRRRRSLILEAAKAGAGRSSAGGSSRHVGMSLMAFLRSVPLFHTLKPSQLQQLADDCKVQTFSHGDFILTQGDESNRTFYIMRSGVVAVYVKDMNDMHATNGNKVATLTEGHYFGERSLMSNRPCAASCVADSEVTCLTVDKAVFHSVLSGIHQLLGDYQRLDNANEEVVSLTQHVHKFMMLSAPIVADENEAGGPRGDEQTLEEQRLEAARRSLLLELLTAFSPELSLDDVIERMVAVTYERFQAERVSVWIKDSDRGCLFLKVSKDARGLRIPFVGLVGHVATTGATLNLPDAYEDDRFDQSTDRETHYRTHSMLVVPIRINNVTSPDEGGGALSAADASDVVGVVQLINRRVPVDHPDALSAGAWAGSRRASVTGNSAAEPDTIVVPFSEEQSDLLQTLSGQLAMVIDSHRLQLLEGASQFMPSHTLRLPFQLNVARLHTNATNRHLKVRVGLYHGGQLLCPEMETDLVDTAPCTTEHGDQRRAVWDDWLLSSIRCCNLPRATRVIFNVYSKNNHPRGWAGCHLVSFDHHMRSGELRLHLWDGECPTPNATCLERPLAEKRGGDGFQPSYLHVEFSTYDKPVLFTNQQEAQGEGDHGGGRGRSGTTTTGRPSGASSSHSSSASSSSSSSSSSEPSSGASHKSVDYFISLLPPERGRRVKAILRNPITPLTDDDQHMVWELRFSLKSKPEALPQFLRSVDWTDPEAVQQAYTLLYSWEPPTPIQALQLLDHKYPDPKVRAYAVQCLSRLQDEKLSIYLLQLTQVLKFEPFHDSALARFLLRRALANPPLIGHVFFWYLKAEMHVPDVQERYGLLLEQYLRNCGHHRNLLGEQQFVMQKLEEVARVVVAQDTKEERKAALHRELRSAVFPDSFQLALNPKYKAKGLIIDKCRVMDSKKKPLWLVFTNAEEGGPNITVMFKAGDDLRQDQLTLQVLAIMDRLWKEEGLDLCMSPYGCVSTGDELGMLEVVMNAETLAGIVAHGRDGHLTSRQRSSSNAGTKKFRAALDAMNNTEVLLNFLQLNNVHQTTGTAEPSRALNPSSLTPGSEDSFDPPRVRRGGVSQAAAALEGHTDSDEAIRRFAKSAAGYCVATYVLGIGDRHNDNIMLKRTGELFHIDFGHFLGNYKSKLGVKRERAPFVFTNAFAAVLGNPGAPLFEEFCREAAEAYNVLRRSAPLMVTLFSLMISCGIPELQTEDDIKWISESLNLDMTEEQASARFTELIFESMNTTTTRLNDAAHLIRVVS